MKTKRKMRPLIIFLLALAIFGTGLSLYGGNSIDYLRDHRENKTLPMADISGRLKNVFNYSELGNHELKNRAANFAHALELLLKTHKIDDIDLCRYDKEFKVEGIILLEEINGRLPERRKFDKGVEFLILTKWTVNHFQILEMKKQLSYLLTGYQ